MDIKLKSKDNGIVSFTKDQVSRMTMVKHIINDIPEIEIPIDVMKIENVEILKAVKDYLDRYPEVGKKDGKYNKEKHRQSVDTNYIHELLIKFKRDLMLACDYLELDDLFDLLAWVAAQDLSSKYKEFNNNTSICNESKKIIEDNMLTYIDDVLFTNKSIVECCNTKV